MTCVLAPTLEVRDGVDDDGVEALFLEAGSGVPPSAAACCMGCVLFWVSFACVATHYSVVRPSRCEQP